MSDTDYTRLQDIGKGAYASIAQMVAALGEAESSGNDAQETAQQRILDDALSVRVRSGWVDVVTDFEAEEFEILLTTGGPAVRIGANRPARGLKCRTGERPGHNTSRPTPIRCSNTRGAFTSDRKRVSPARLQTPGDVASRGVQSRSARSVYRHCSCRSRRGPWLSVRSPCRMSRPGPFIVPRPPAMRPGFEGSNMNTLPLSVAPL